MQIIIWWNSLCKETAWYSYLVNYLFGHCEIYKMCPRLSNTYLKSYDLWISIFIIFSIDQWSNIKYNKKVGTKLLKIFKKYWPRERADKLCKMKRISS